MQALIINIINKFGYLGVLLLIAIENIFPPIPSEIILTFGGFMTKMPNSILTIVGVIIAATLGSILGAIALYYIGKILNKERLKKIVSGKIGKILFLKPKDIEKADKWFDEKGNKTVFFCRFIPVIRSLISIPAGMTKMNMSKFVGLTFIGSLVWNVILVLLGAKMGENWPTIANFVDQYSKIVAIIIVIIFIVYIVNKVVKKRKRK